MDATPRQLFRNLLHSGAGELVARLLSIAIVVLLGHLYGVVAVGVYALAMSVSQYLPPVIDFGLRHIGARLIARFPGSASEIVRRVQQRRFLMASVAISLVLAYAAVARLPFHLKVFLFLFAAISCLYAFSLDWAAWGRERMLLVGLAKAIAPAGVLLGLLIALVVGHLYGWLVIGNLVGYSLQALFLWAWWRRHKRDISGASASPGDIAAALEWRYTSVMGLAWLGNMAFNTSDMLVLGAFSNPHELGLYSASYRILNQFLMAYYLLTNVLFPQFARQDASERRRMLRPRVFALLFLSGSTLALLVMMFRKPLLAIIFGGSFVAAAPLLLLLACCIPLDFLVSYLSNAYFAWNQEKGVLICAAVSATANLVLNLLTIPRFGALAAAVNTVLSYLIYLTGLMVGRYKLLAREAL